MTTLTAHHRTPIHISEFIDSEEDLEKKATIVKLAEITSRNMGNL